MLASAPFGSSCHTWRNDGIGAELWNVFSFGCSIDDARQYAVEPLACSGAPGRVASEKEPRAYAASAPLKSAAESETRRPPTAVAGMLSSRAFAARELPSAPPTVVGRLYCGPGEKWPRNSRMWRRDVKRTSSCRNRPDLSDPGPWRPHVGCDDFLHASTNEPGRLYAGPGDERPGSCSCCDGGESG